ncbi:hypothetical protein ACLKMI_01905 [Pseudoalteromonas sp. KJ71-7]|uniref:hypothetical protein n=1 Tax=Pseudoalteromonas sp. KJ71-7 TaxID=3391824 RepID=UPI0039B0AD66
MNCLEFANRPLSFSPQFFTNLQFDLFLLCSLFNKDVSNINMESFLLCQLTVT